LELSDPNASCPSCCTRVRTDESITVRMSPFAPRKLRGQNAAFAERKATLIPSPILNEWGHPATLWITSLFSSPGVYACGAENRKRNLFSFEPPSGGDDWPIDHSRPLRSPSTFCDNTVRWLSRRDCVRQPRVVAQRLPWVKERRNTVTPKGFRNGGTTLRNPFRVDGVVGAVTG